MIHLSKVTKLTGGNTVLRDATMLLPKGAYAILRQDSELTGSALFRLLMGYEQPSRGSIRINDINVARLSSERLPFLRRGIGWLEYQPTIAHNRTVTENLAMPLQIAGFDHRAMRERISEKLVEAGLHDVAEKPAGQLDNTQQLVLGAARATIHKPQTILANCPGEEVDANRRELIFNLLEHANAGGATVLMVTSDTLPARRFSHTLHSYKGALRQEPHRCGVASHG